MVATLVCTGLVIAALIYVIYLLDNIEHQTKRLRRIMGAAQDAVDAVSVQLGKAKDEIISKIDDLEAQVEAGETPDLTALKAAAQSLDDVIPDAPVEEPPVVNPPVEEPPVGDTPAEPTE